MRSKLGLLRSTYRGLLFGILFVMIAFSFRALQTEYFPISSQAYEVKESYYNGIHSVDLKFKKRALWPFDKCAFEEVRTYIHTEDGAIDYVPNLFTFKVGTRDGGNAYVIHHWLIYTEEPLKNIHGIVYHNCWIYKARSRFLN